jgi:Domain of unknown function (DUF4279)
MIDYVALTLRGESLDPDDVTRRLNVQPSRSFARGDTTAHPLPTKFGYWRLKIDGPHGELNRHLGKLLESFDEKYADLADFAKSNEVIVTVVVELGSVDESELSISSDLIDRISAMKAQLRVYWLHGSTTENSVGSDRVAGEKSKQVRPAVDEDEVV